MAYQSNTTAGDSSGPTLTIAIPAGATTDWILLMHFYGEVSLGLTPTFDVGTWTKITAASGQQLGESTDFEVYRYWARWGTQSGNIVISWGGANIWRAAACLAFSGRLTSGDPQDATATFTAAGAANTTATMNGLTVGHASADLILLESDVNGSAHTGWTLGTERVDFGGQGIATVDAQGSGASGNQTVSIASSFYTGAQIVLQVAGAAAAIVNKALQARQAVKRASTY